MSGLARKRRAKTESSHPKIVEISHYEVETDSGITEADFKDFMDAIEHVVNLVLAGDCKRAKVRATISIEAVEQ